MQAQAAEHRLLEHNFFDGNVLYLAGIDVHYRFVNENKSGKGKKHNGKIKFIFGYTFKILKYNVNHNAEQCILIHGSDGKTDVGQRPVAPKECAAAFLLRITEYPHHGNGFGVPVYNGCDGKKQGCEGQNQPYQHYHGTHHKAG